MNYYNWNKVLTEHFFKDKFANRQVLLNITKERLENLAGVVDFKKAVLSFGDKNMQNKIKKLITIYKAEEQQINLSDSEIQLWNERKDYPPFLACLVFLVLAIREEGSGYYEKLQKLINNCNGYQYCDIFPKNTLDRHIFNAWKLLENWSYDNEPNIGIFKTTTRTSQSYYTVIRVTSQKLLSNSERRKVYNSLREDGFSKNFIPNKIQLDFSLSNFTWKYQNYFGISKKMSSYETIKKETVFNVILNDLQRGLWEAEGVENIEVLNIHPFIIPGVDNLKIVYRADIDYLHDTNYFGNYEVSPSKTHIAWSKEINIENNVLLNGFSQANDNFILNFKGRKLRVFGRSDKIYGENSWEEINQINIGNEYLILVHESLQSLFSSNKAWTEYPNDTVQNLPQSFNIFYTEQSSKKYVISQDKLIEITNSDKIDKEPINNIDIKGGILARGKNSYFTFAPPKLILRDYDSNFKIYLDDNKINPNIKDNRLHILKTQNDLILSLKTNAPLKVVIKYTFINEESEEITDSKKINLVKPKLSDKYKEINHIGEIQNDYKISIPQKNELTFDITKESDTNKYIDKYCLTTKEQNIENIKSEFGWPKPTGNGNFIITIDANLHYETAIQQFEAKCQQHNNEIKANVSEEKIIKIVKYIQQFEFLSTEVKHSKKDFDTILLKYENVRDLYLPFLIWDSLTRYCVNQTDNNRDFFLTLFDDFLGAYHWYLLESVGKTRLIYSEKYQGKFYLYKKLVEVVIKQIIVFIGIKPLKSLLKIQEFIKPVTKKNDIFENINIFLKHFNQYSDNELPLYFYNQFKKQNGWYNFTILDKEKALHEIRNKQLRREDFKSEYILAAISHHSDLKVYGKKFQDNDVSLQKNIYKLLKKRYYPSDFNHGAEFNRLIYSYDSLGACIYDNTKNRIYAEQPIISFINTDTNGNRRFVLSGARTPDFILYIQKEIKNHKDITLEIKDQPTKHTLLYPKILIFTAKEKQITSFVKILNENYKFNIKLNNTLELSKIYLQKSITIDNCLNKDGLPNLDPNAQSTHLYYDLNGYKFKQDETKDNILLIKEQHNYGKSYYYIYNRINNEYRELNCEWGVMFLLQKYNQNVCFYNKEEQLFLVPISIQLPKLISRALTACSGMIPKKNKFKDFKGNNNITNTNLESLYNQTEKYNKFWYVYENVSEDFASVVFEKLGQTKLFINKR